MESNLTEKLLENYKSKRLASAKQETTSEEDAQLWGYRKAAAVLHSFIPEQLVPPENIKLHSNPRNLLYEDITYSPGRFAEGIFTLDPEVRRQALRRFGSTKEMLALLQKNPNHPQTFLQEIFENYLRTEQLPDPEQLSYKDLLQMCQLCGWLEGITPKIPSSESLKSIAQRKSVVASFEHLVTKKFTGRETEIALLKRHVTANQQPKSKNKIQSLIVNWISSSIPKPILSIYGPGGIGKSALVGKILLDNTLEVQGSKIPFAYMPFDLGNLRIESPFTILIEATSQFANQFPQYQDEIGEFHSMMREFRTNRSKSLERQIVSHSRSYSLTSYLHLQETLYIHFAELINKMSIDEKRVRQQPGHILLVFDTFEEVEYRDSEDLDVFWGMLEKLVELSPALRIIISGRTSIAKLGIDKNLLTELALEELNPEDRRLLLQRLGMDEKNAIIIAEQIGGNPLSLMLAANLLESDKNAADAKGIKDLTQKKWLLFQVDEQLIQGQLYRRILDHIHDENVKVLAHPGMVLRRINPEIILGVLAKECKLNITTLEEAEIIFNSLKKEQAIVQNGTQGDLVYRPEIRESMIKLLMQDKMHETKQLRRAAIAFYSEKDDESSRAEEIYHRLALGEDDATVLDSRWIPGIETSIASNLKEYPDNLKVWLATRINLEIPRETFQNADVADWERNIFRKVKQAMSEYNLTQALKLLEERNERTWASPLFALEAKTHLLRDVYDDAIVAIEEGISLVSRSSNRGRLAELFWLRSQAEILKKMIKKADESLKEASTIMQNAIRPLPYMHIICHRILLRNKYKSEFPENTLTLMNELNNACSRIDLNPSIKDNFVIQLSAFLLGNEYPKTRDRLVGTQVRSFSHAEEMLTSENLQGLDEYRENWENEDQYSVKAML